MTSQPEQTATADRTDEAAVDQPTETGQTETTQVGTAGTDPAENGSSADESPSQGSAEAATDGEARPVVEGTTTTTTTKDNPLETEAEIAADYLEELLDIADLDGDIDTYIDNGRAQVSIVTDSNVLVGKDGEVLEALQELVRLAVMAETDGRTRLMLDVAGFRDKRRATLKELATDAIQEVKDSGEAVRLAPMNPFERKIIHDAVAEGGLTSESEGAEPHRRVVVMPA